MKKLFLMALVALMSLQSVAQDSTNIIIHKINTSVSANIKTGWNGTSKTFKENVVLYLPDVDFGDQCTYTTPVGFTLKDGDTKTIPLDIEYEKVDANESIHRLNRGVKVFAGCEIAALAVSTVTAAVVLVSTRSEDPETITKNKDIAKTTAVVGVCAAAVLHTIGIISLSNNSMKNFYISDKGVGFKIDIK